MFLADLSHFSLQSLRVFVYVASLGSVAEAAGAMGLTQPAISLQIHNLEDHLGYALFEKKGRRNFLTPRGQALLQQLLPQLEKLEGVLVSSREAERLVRPQLTIGSVEGIGEYWMRQRFSDFSGKHKDLRFFLEISETAMLEERLLTGRLSAVITPRKLEHPRVISQVLMDERLVPVGRKKAIKEFKEALEGNEALKALSKFAWIGYGDSSYSDPWAPRWLEARGIVLDQRFEYMHQVNSYAVIKQLLLEGEGICVAPHHTVEAELASGELIALDSEKYPALKNRLYLSHREGALNPLHKEFKDWILNKAKT